MPENVSISESGAAITGASLSTRMIPLNQVAGYPPFLSDGNPGGSLIDEVLANPATLRSLERFTPAHRAALADALLGDLRRWDAPEAALEGAVTLGEPGTYAVVTGQQAGVAGGPMYTLYKAMGAVLAAGELRRRFPEHRFVPVFWIEADDHDFQEVRGVTVLDRAGNPATFQYDDGVERPLHVGDRENSTEGFTALIAGLREALPPTEFTDGAMALLEEGYRPGETLADGFARALYAMLGDTPLVLLSSRNPALKPLAADVIAREAAEPSALFNAVHARSEALKGAHMPTPIDPKPGALFITHEGERRSLDPDGEGYIVRGTNQRLTFQQAAELARTEPERFSPKVSLRPLVQDAILPTALYLGGPSEVAYLNQLDDAYGVFGLQAPAVAPRPFVLLLEPKVRRALETSGMELETLLAGEFDAAALLVDKELEGELEAAAERALEGIGRAYAELEEITRRIDPTLEKTLGSATANATKGVEDLGKRLGSALKKKQQTGIDRLNSARAMVMPGGAMQERTLNALYLVNKYGPERLREFLAAIRLVDGVLQVVEI